MPRDGTPTREKILETSQRLIMQRGYAGVSIDSIIEKVGITKGAFFYHFKSKGDLAKALIQRYREIDHELFNDMAKQAHAQTSDPLQSILIFIGLFEDLFDRYEKVYPGCLFASYIYEIQQFDEETSHIIHETFMFWRHILRDWLEEIIRLYPPKIDVDTTYLADTFTSTMEGAFVMAKATDDPKAIPQQIRQFKNYIELLFSP